MALKLMTNSMVLEKCSSFDEGMGHYGLAGVEFSLNNTRLPVNRFYWPYLRKRLSVTGVLSFHMPFIDMEIASKDPLVADASVQMAKVYVTKLAEFKPAYLNMHIATDAYEDEASKEVAIANLRKLSAFAKEHGQRLAVENVRVGITSNPDIFREIIWESGVYATIDIGHARGSDWLEKHGGGDPMDFVRGIEDQILAAHVYALEINGGHQPARDIEEIRPFLESFKEAGVEYWVLEHHNAELFEVTLGTVKAWLDGMV